MISKLTSNRVVQVIFEWARERGISHNDIALLLAMLLGIPGNKSFKDSIAHLNVEVGCERHRRGIRI